MTILSRNTQVESQLGQIFDHDAQSLEDDSVVLLILNAEEIITYATPSVTSLIGYLPQEIIGSSLQSILHADDPGSFRRVFSVEDDSTGKVLRVETCLSCKNGALRWLEGHITNLLQMPQIGGIICHLRASMMHKQASILHWSELSVPEHFVQFYESDDFLLDSLSDFVEQGLNTGEMCILFLSERSRKGCETRLLTRGIDLDRARLQGQYLALDASETLSGFMVDAMPDAVLFAQMMEKLLKKSTKNQQKIRIFGDFAAILWEDGKQEAAIHLEALWNDLLDNSPPISLFCAYPIRNFAGEMYNHPFSEICQLHSHVIPDESYNRYRSQNNRFRAITALQQKATSLQAEILERKRIEAEFLHMAAIIESSDDAILSKDLDGIITSWNPAAERMYGYSPTEIIGQSVTILMIQDGQNKNEFLDIMTRIRRGERIEHYETIRVCKDGSRLTVSVTVSPIKDSRGVLIGASAIARDITETKHLETKFRRLFDSNLIGVFVSDFGGTFLDANDALLDLLGYTRAELLRGDLHRDLLTPPELYLVSQKGLKDLQERGASGPYEKEYFHKSGRRISVIIAVTQIEKGDTCIGFVLDNSEQKALDQRKDEFISMASHELKTPLTSLKGFITLLQRLLKKEEEQEALHYLTRMDAQVKKLTNLINDLLDVSKMQTGQLVYRKEEFAIDTLVQEIVENLQAANQTHHLQIQGKAQVEIFGDRDRLGQVLINLLTNAMKYSPQADRVCIHVAQEQQNILIRVQDFGIGIAKAHQEKIFERFYQISDPEENTYPGLGIGLYISFGIIKRHGGKIWVESEKGAGTNFNVLLPIHEYERC